MIDARGLRVRIGRYDLLGGVDVRLEPGRVLAVIGPNGAGKSTLLRVLAGDRRPDEGSVSMDGRDVTAWHGAERARRRAVLLQESSFAFPFEAIDVVCMGRAPHGAPRDSRSDRIIARAALDAVGAGSLGRRNYASLSGGERQRVQIARVFAQIWEPSGGGRYVLLDEPTSSLDPLHQHLVLEQMRRLTAGGVAALVILHDLNLVAGFADDALLLKRGTPLAAGPVDVVLTAENLTAAFDLPFRVVPHPDRGRPLIVSGDVDGSARARAHSGHTLPF